MTTLNDFPGNAGIIIAAAAGSSSRFVVGNKLLYELTLNGEEMPVICHTVATCAQLVPRDRLVLVYNPDCREELEAALSGFSSSAGVSLDQSVTWVAGATTRGNSVCNGLHSLPDEVVWAAVQDGARPKTTTDLFSAALDSAMKEGGAVVARPVADTVKLVRDGNVVEADIDRDKLAFVETPQIFKKEALLAAYERVFSDGVRVTDEAGAMQHAGEEVKLFFHEQDNGKITYLSDI